MLLWSCSEWAGKLTTELKLSTFNNAVVTAYCSNKVQLQHCSHFENKEHIKFLLVVLLESRPYFLKCLVTVFYKFSFHLFSLSLPILLPVTWLGSFFSSSVQTKLHPKRVEFQQREKRGNEDLSLQPFSDHFADGCSYIMKKMIKAGRESVLFYAKLLTCLHWKILPQEMHRLLKGVSHNI